MNKTPLFYRLSFFFFFFLCASMFTTATTTTTFLPGRDNHHDIINCPSLTGKAKADDQLDSEMVGIGKKVVCRRELVVPGQKLQGVGRRRRRYLSGLGSSPPRCVSKCGRCTPCKPVHVAVPPGTPVTSEYYPEAWRCKCGNKLYMP